MPFMVHQNISYNTHRYDYKRIVQTNNRLTGLYVYMSICATFEWLSIYIVVFDVHKIVNYTFAIQVIAAGN
jgi:hypothetical protein